MTICQVRKATGRALFGALVIAFVGAGCAIDISIEADPNPPQVGSPATYTVDVSNPLTCPLTSPSVYAFVLPEDSEEPGSGDAFCDLANDPTELVCSLIGDVFTPEPDSPILESCCEDPDFANDNAQLCESCQETEKATEVRDLGDEVRELIIARAREAGLPVDDALAAEASAGESTSCSGFLGGGVCDLDDIPMGASDQVSFEATIPAPGRYFALAFVVGESDCSPVDLISGGSTCERLNVSAPTMAPLLSLTTTAGLALALAALGVFAVRRKRART